jgi:tRNA wybutosine-synthesizing protein 1
LDDSYRQLLLKQRYKPVGEHSGVKLCHWMRQKLYYGRVCYKEHFYGIQCHRCLQISPALDACTHQCIFCWRYPGPDGATRTEWDEPEKLLDAMILGQRQLVSGFKGDERCDVNLWNEAQNPTQVAISLAGEPTLYPYLGDLIALCAKKGMTTFLVTNGTMPDVLDSLNPLPTQLYVTVAAPNPEIYAKICRPAISNGWDRILKTLELLPSLKGRTRTVIRHTLVEGWNVGWESEYSKLDSTAAPDFVECKGYVFVGHSRKTMSMANMPRFERIQEFSANVAAQIGYAILGEKSDSRVSVLGDGKKKMKL